jgi:hypothetical protein
MKTNRADVQGLADDIALLIAVVTKKYYSPPSGSATYSEEIAQELLGCVNIGSGFLVVGSLRNFVASLRELRTKLTRSLGATKIRQIRPLRRLRHRRGVGLSRG